MSHSSSDYILALNPETPREATRTVVGSAAQFQLFMVFKTI